MSEAHAIDGFFDIQHGTGRVKVTVSLANWTHQRLPPPRPLYLPALLTHRFFEIHEGMPFVFGKNREVVGFVKDVGTSSALIDTATKRRVYSMAKSSFFKKEYTISDDSGVFGRCFHKMKTIRKKKLRMFLLNSEWLFSMAGGCFDHKEYDNEVYIQNAVEANVASVLLGMEEDGKDRKRRVMVIHILDPSIDACLMLMFGLYAIRTL